jgi:hypothetical protein
MPRFSLRRDSLLLDVGAEFEHILFAGHLKLVGETKVLNLDLRGRRETQRNGSEATVKFVGSNLTYYQTG